MKTETNNTSIEEMNKTIAIWMGWNLWCNDKVQSPQKPRYNCVDCSCLNPNDLWYERRWDQLMPVWSKLRPTLLNQATSRDWAAAYCNAILDALDQANIRKAHIEVYNAITYLNNKKGC